MWRPVPGRDYIGNNTPGKPFTGQKSLPRGSRDPSLAKVGRNETESDYFLRFLSNRSPIESSFLPRYPDIRRRRKGGRIKQTKEKPLFPRHHPFHVASYSCGSVCGCGRTGPFDQISKLLVGRCHLAMCYCNRKKCLRIMRYIWI